MLQLQRLTASLLLSASLFAVGTASVAAQSVGVLATTGTDPNPRAVALDYAYLLGSRNNMWGGTWSEFEPWPGFYNFTELDTELQLIKSSYFGCCGDSTPVTLINIEVINVTNRTTPWDLAWTPFDSPRMQARFHALIDALIPHLVSGANVRYMMIGEEVNLYLALHPAEWPQYINFYADAVSYLHQHAPTLRVGVPTLYSSATYSAAALQDLIKLNAPSDVVAMTYTSGPLNGPSLDQQASAPLSDFPTMVTSMVANGRPLVLQEVGFPSDVSVGSSEQLQSQFVKNVFTALRSPQVNGKVAFLSFIQLHDYAQSTCDNLATTFGLWFWPGASAFFCSLGFLHHDGTPKPAITEFAAGAAAFNQIKPFTSARPTQVPSINRR